MGKYNVQEWKQIILTNSMYSSMSLNMFKHTSTFILSSPCFTISIQCRSSQFKIGNGRTTSLVLVRWIISEVLFIHFEHLGIFFMIRLYISLLEGDFQAFCFLFITLLCLIQCFKHSSCSSSLRSILKSQVWLKCFKDVSSIKKWLISWHFWWHHTLFVEHYSLYCVRFVLEPGQLPPNTSSCFQL